LKNRTSSHFFILVLIVLVTAIAHYSIYYGALIRGYETSDVTAGRNLFLLSLLAIIPIFLKNFVRYKGSWTLYTAAVLLFSMGLTVQYRLFSDPEYTSRKDKAQARQEKIRTLQLHYIQQTYSADKKQMMGLPPTPPSPVDLSKETPRPATESLSEVLLSGNTVNPMLGIIGLLITFLAMRREKVLEILQKNGFLVGLALLVIPLTVLRALSYVFPVPINFTNLELFDPSIYGANFILKSLGDLFINSILFIWVVLFVRYHFKYDFSKIKLFLCIPS